MSSTLYNHSRVNDPHFMTHVERAVRIAQEKLLEQGLLKPGDVDGKLGPRTAEALSRLFAQRRELVSNYPVATCGYDIARLAAEQIGKPYVWGTELKADNANPSAFDCSELVEWICARFGVQPMMPDGSWIQFRHCARHASGRSKWDGSVMLEYAKTPGALLFAFSSDPMNGPRPTSAHVAIVFDDKHVVEAKSHKDGVVKSLISSRKWTHSARIPGVQY